MNFYYKQLTAVVVVVISAVQLSSKNHIKARHHFILDQYQLKCPAEEIIERNGNLVTKNINTKNNTNHKKKKIKPVLIQS